MPKYSIGSVLTISVFTEVEADSKEEAIEEAGSRSVMSLCHQCSRGDYDAEWCTSGELDGEPDFEQHLAVDEID